jgi:predicted restriction endonuclease
LSGSVGRKSRGLADIDYRISELRRRGRLVRDRWDPWRLASPKPLAAKEFVLPPSDIGVPPDRIQAHVQRIVRDTAAAESLKALYDYKCQVCGLRIEPSSGSYYIEVHHVKPLGGGQSGLDTHANRLVLCPNHHAMFDFGIPRFVAANEISIADTVHTLTCKHKLSDDVIASHNERIHKGTA